MNAFLGLDVSKKKIDCFLISESLNKSIVITNNNIGFNKLIEFLNKNNVFEFWACCEATGIYYLELAKFIKKTGNKISVVNPFQIKSYSNMVLQRGKTDMQDAKLIAMYCQLNKPIEWFQESEENIVLSNLVKELEYLKSLKVMQNNRIQVSFNESKQRLINHVEYINTLIVEVETDIKLHITSNEKLKNAKKLLSTIPALGEVSIPWLLVLLSDQKFKKGKQAVSFVGLSPKEHQSGSSVRGRTRISKIGQKAIRKSLYMPAVVAFSRVKVYQEFVERLQKAGKSAKVIIVALMRKLLIIAHAVLATNTAFDETRYLKKC